ncbi:beta-glucosidase 42 [Ricinus communis]|uniref:beta-glucosidase 42 n=1 Tax=Ricinus communis TaxID=3988 RepID=UPI000772B514|nr:beta-glucosidase 42 [Ricinus communis]|eukprot:XP_015572236.1 beta-glucosidase 42 [Ricinus communis]
MGGSKEDLLKERQYLEEKEVSRSDFPPSFVFGVATSAYQIEGGCKDGGRGPSIWDAFSHTQGNILDGSNADVAVDHYHRYKEDIELIAKLGFDAYRFSLSWSRIFPDGLGTKVNDEGISFYNNIINALLDKGIEPYITLYHWDLPLHLQDSIGGWLNKDIVKYFAIYADTCFASFGDRVKNWITLNEPLQTSVNGYDGGIFAPGRHEQSETEPYLVAHHQILAHSAAVCIYRSKYKEIQGGQIGIVVDCEWAEPNSDKSEDKTAAARRLEFQIGWYLHPIYYGEYPEVMSEILGDRLPKFSEEDKELLRNPIDFLGLNHYTSRFITHVAHSKAKSYYYRAQAMDRLAEWEGGEPIGEKAASEWLYVCPWGIRKVLNHIVQRYNSPQIYITENGMDDEESDAPLHEMLDDKLRVRYFKGYLASVAEAIKDGADVRGYFAWSLLDNFEWAQGYTKRFGLVYVDYKNGLARHPKSSAYWFLRFLKGGEGKKDKEE